MFQDEEERSATPVTRADVMRIVAGLLIGGIFGALVGGLTACVACAMIGAIVAGGESHR